MNLRSGNCMVLASIFLLWFQLCWNLIYRVNSIALGVTEEPQVKAHPNLHSVVAFKFFICKSFVRVCFPTVKLAHKSPYISTGWSCTLRTLHYRADAVTSLWGGYFIIAVQMNGDPPHTTSSGATPAKGFVSFVGQMHRDTQGGREL